MIEFTDGNTIFLQQAVVDAIIRAYTSVALHPTRKATELILHHLPASLRKEGFAKWQLIESHRSETEVLREAAEKYFLSDETRAPDAQA